MLTPWKGCSIINVALPCTLPTTWCWSALCACIIELYVSNGFFLCSNTGPILQSPGGLSLQTRWQMHSTRASLGATMLRPWQLQSNELKKVQPTIKLTNAACCSGLAFSLMLHLRTCDVLPNHAATCTTLTPSHTFYITHSPCVMEGIARQSSSFRMCRISFS